MESSILSSLADDGTAIVAVQGEIDFSNADELARCLCAAVADGAPVTVRVDLERASFIDSTGLGALLEGYRAAVESGIRYTVVNPTDGFRRVLAVTGLTGLFGLDAADSAAEPAEEAAESAEEAAQATGA
jgi:anti-sigma B factor antagonist